MISYQDVLNAVEELKTTTHYQNVVEIVGDNQELQNYIAVTIDSAVEEMGCILPKQTSKGVTADKLDESIESKYDDLIKSLLLLGRHDEADELKRLQVKYEFENLDESQTSRARFYKVRSYKNDLKKSMIETFFNKFNLPSTKSTQLTTALIATL